MHRGLTYFVLITILTVAFVIPLSGCGSSAAEQSPGWALVDDESADSDQVRRTMGLDDRDSSGPLAFDTLERAGEALEALVPSGAPGQPGSPGMPGVPAAATPAPAPATMASEQAVEVEVVKVVQEVAKEVTAQSIAEDDSTRAQLVTQRRIIIREVDMSLVVDDIQVAIDDIAEMAANAGGWVVDSGRWSLHSGSISIRVPADVLDDTIEELRDLANRVDAENTTSRDVTDEYVDLESRLKNQRAAHEALLKLLERAESVDTALAVQRDLSRVQEEVERLSGRIKFLEESSAFSIIRINLSLAPVDVEVDAGADQTVAVGVPVKFRATFSPPDGIEDSTIVWDFGDASGEQVVHRTAPTQKPGELTTATVNHVYGHTVGSPFIAQVSITGTGEGGIVEGKDTLTVSVSEVPAIEVFAGEWKAAVQNTEVEFSGSFTRPLGLTNVRFEWEFGDGQPPVTGDLPEDVTRATATHVYRDYRPEPYVARLTIRADSEVGEVESSQVVAVRVQEQLGFVVRGYDFAGSLKSAVRGLSSFAQNLAVALIWVVIFIPLWAIIAAVIWLIVRAWRWRKSRRSQEMPEQEASAEV